MEEYIVSARKYRPTSFDTVVGQQALTTTLKNAVVTIIAVLLIGFLDENSVWSHFKNQQRIEELQDEIKRQNDQYNHDQKQIRKLNSDPKAIEKIARERYFMKADDEDIFVLSDDEATLPKNTDETVE